MLALSVYVVTPVEVVPICVKFTPSVLRWMTKPFSFPAALSVQLSATWAPTAVALSAVGAAGAVGNAIVAVAMFE